MKSTSFERFAGTAAILAGLVGLLYSISFVILHNGLLSALFLMLGGLLSIAALVALFNRLGEADSGFALLGLILGGVGALGAAVHGAYDLANLVNPPAENTSVLASLPSQIDPRGFLTFGAAGLALFVAGFLMSQHTRFRPTFRGLTYVLATLLIIVYLGRLIILAPSSPLLLIPAAITGFIVNPLWYIWLGVELRAGQAYAAMPTAAKA
jgi:hypothetical protein